VRPRVQGSAGFTILELLIIVSILGILSALLVPMMSDNAQEARLEALASNAAYIRNNVVYHSGLATAPLSPQGFVVAIDPAWFRHGRIPDHPFAESPMVIEVVSLAPSAVFPLDKTFDPDLPGDPSAWYNTSNGMFCARVPAQPTDAQTLRLFNEANKTSATSLNQTTH
jgi:general secretion pathway protein G